MFALQINPHFNSDVTLTNYQQITSKFKCNFWNIIQLFHRLRPGDIQIVAALGDALVSAQGALSTDITTAGKQYRGVSFATGMLKN